ncbi:MAG: hypothetical protein P8K12_01445, partial [Polaribacter sp.]|nr:hypothetical protein [Polaribacter sp.]MDG2150873.1 hypothetical protein [Polaribacter sp.]
MKYSILLLSSLFMISCANISNQEVVETSKEIGFDKTEGVKTSLFGGNMETVAIWEKYIKAHNERDIETIKGLNAEKDFKAYGPRGEIIVGTKDHVAFLNQWFADNNPKWVTKYSIANEFTTKEGVLKQYVTSGHDVTLVVDGKEVKVNQVHDALIVDG